MKCDKRVGGFILPLTVWVHLILAGSHIGLVVRAPGFCALNDSRDVLTPIPLTQHTGRILRGLLGDIAWYGPVQTFILLIDVAKDKSGGKTLASLGT